MPQSATSTSIAPTQQPMLQIPVTVLVAHGSKFGRNPEWGPKFRRSGLGLGCFPSTWRQLNLNYLNIGFSLRCKGSKTIDKPSPNVLDLLRSGGPFKSADVWKCVSEKLSERGNLNWNIPGQKTLESGTEQKLWPEFLRNLQPSQQHINQYHYP
jgi:hypothetical protein